jgi:hypothetical protein
VVDLWDRLINRVELWGATSDPEHSSIKAIPLSAALTEVGEVLRSDLSSIACEPALEALEARIASSPPAAFPAVYDGNLVLRTLCYVLCRALAPVSAVETGVANGATSAYLLAALDKASTGRLYSIDWMPGGAGRRLPVGDLVPDDLRERWSLRVGPSRRVLAPLLRTIDPPSLFVHDSSHTYRNMRRELDTVTPFMRRPGVILVDDIQVNGSFVAWAGNARPAYYASVGTERPDHFVGVAVLT